MHDDDSARKKANSSNGVVIDGVKASWIQRRMCDIYLEKEKVSDTDPEWSPCYEQAAKEYEEQHE
jgi:hypothetical protein